MNETSTLLDSRTRVVHRNGPEGCVDADSESRTRRVAIAATNSAIMPGTIFPDVNGRFGDSSACGEESPSPLCVTCVPAIGYGGPRRATVSCMFMIRRTANGEVVFALIGRMGQENLAELKSVITSEKHSSEIVLDLRDVTLVDRGTVRYLGRCERKSIKLRNCPGYIREWIDVNSKQQTRPEH